MDTTTAKRDQVFIARLSDAEKKTLAELAESRGVSMGEIVREWIEREARKRAAKERRENERNL